MSNIYRENLIIYVTFPQAAGSQSVRPHVSKSTQTGDSRPLSPANSRLPTRYRRQQTVYVQRHTPHARESGLLKDP